MLTERSCVGFDALTAVNREVGALVLLPESVILLQTFLRRTPAIKSLSLDFCDISNNNLF